MRIAELVEVIGTDAALALTQRYGGTRCYIPATVDQAHPLVRAIGMAASLKLCGRAHGEWLDIPKGHPLITRRRDAEIFELRRAGFSASEVARCFEMTERAVRMAMARHRAAQQPA